MKTTLPEHPHTASLRIFADNDCTPFAMIEVEISVPSRVAALLPEQHGIHFIRCAHVIDSNNVRQRARNWKSGPRIGARKIQPIATYLDQAAAEGCDASIKIEIRPEEWHFIGMLCGQLRITPGQWFVACATYNAEVEDRSIEAMLAGMVEIDATDTAA